MSPKVIKPKISVLFSTPTFITPYRSNLESNFDVQWSPIPYTPPPKKILEYFSFPFRLINKKIRTFFSSNKADILFVEFANETLALVSKIRKSKMIVTRLHRYELFSLPNANWSVVDLVVVVNNWMARELEDKLPSLKGKIICIPNFVDVDYWHKPKKHIINNQISMIGNIEERKGHDKAIIAFSKVLKEKKDLKFKIIGKCKNQAFLDSLKLLVDDLGLASSIEFVGYAENLRKEYHNSDIILSFSEHESTHLTLFEGLSCGAWPLSRNWEGVDEFLPSSNIFLNEEDFVKKVLSFYSNDIPQNLNDIGSLASSVLPKFSNPDPRKTLSDTILKHYLTFNKK